MKKGKHLHLDKITHVKAAEIKVECLEPIPLAVDGELAGEKDEPVSLDCRVIAGALSVIVPDSGEVGHQEN
jgi:diacylglycerol kinase family enzyme